MRLFTGPFYNMNLIFTKATKDARVSVAFRCIAAYSRASTVGIATGIEAVFPAGGT